MPYPFVSGSSNLSASGSVGDAGKPQWISGFTFKSGGTVAQPYFVNGTTTVSAGAATVFQAGGGAANSYGVVQNLGPWPVVFPLGCYVSFDANTTAVTVFYVQAIT